MFDNDTGILHIYWSDDVYSNHSVLREIRLPKPYQANLFTINGIPITLDNKIPIAVRNPSMTDQGRIKHITPAGFIDVLEVNGVLEAEGVKETVIRKLFDELRYSPTLSESPHEATYRELSEELSFPREAFNPQKMRLIGIVYNWLKNFDYTAAVTIPLDCMSNEISLAGAEHEELEWVDTDLFTLKRLLFDLAFAPETNSGHLRGDIGMLIAHLHGGNAYKIALENACLEIEGFSDFSVG